MVLLASSGCAALPPSGPLEYLDEQTAATVTAVAAPLMFARARPELASNARDYATVAAVNVNRSGHIETLLLVWFWSTVDPRIRTEPPSLQTLILLADDRTLRLERDMRTPKEAGISRPLYAPAASTVSVGVYRTDVPMLRFLATSTRLKLRLGDSETAGAFDLWRDERAALADFLNL
jgi:hypothetical protein